MNYLVCIFIQILSIAFLTAPSTAPTKTSAIEREIQFDGVGGVKLLATLAMPEASKIKPGAKVPGVVLICGSGPTDRNGNQPPLLVTDVYTQIADDLASRGIASLRYDKRGVGAGKSSLPADMKSLAEYCKWENFSGDVSCALRELQQQQGIDVHHTGLVGHSEGGMLALCAADAMKGEPNPPRVLVLIGTPGRPIDVIIDEQLKLQLTVQKATPAQLKKFLDKSNEIAGSIRATGEVPRNVPPGLVGLYPPYIGKFFQSELAVDTVKLAAGFKGAVLVVNGEKDLNISAERDAPVLDAALRSRTEGVQEMYIAPRGSHSLKAVHGDLDPGFTGPIIPEALQKIGRFLEEQLKN